MPQSTILLKFGRENGVELIITQPIKTTVMSLIMTAFSLLRDGFNKIGC